MTTTLGDAAIRLVVETEDAERAGDELDASDERRKDRRGRDEDKRKTDQGRKDKKAFDEFLKRAQSRIRKLTPQGAVASIRRRAAETRAGRLVTTIAAAGGALGLTAVAVEEFGPGATAAARSAFKGTPLAAAFELMDERVNALASQIGDLRATLSAVFQAKDQVGAIALTRILAAPPGGPVVNDLPSVAKALFLVNQAFGQAERDRQRLTRRIVGEAVGDLMAESFRASMR